MVKNVMSQRQFKGGYAPHQPVDPNGTDIREANSPSKQRKRQGVALGFETQARPGLSGMQGRAPAKKGRK